MSSNITINLGNIDAVRLITHPFYNIHAIISKRKAFIIYEDVNKFAIWHAILDEDKTETFMCCEFVEVNIKNSHESINDKKLEEDIYLMVAGANGIIKMIDLENGRIKRFLKGHGNTINALKTYTRDRSILFSGSADLSIRMWDIKTGETICIFGGIAGHKDQILSLDVSLCGKYLVSGSHDCTVKMWEIPVKCVNCRKYCIEGHDCRNKQEINCICFPIFSSAEIHRSFITCVRFYGNFIMAKGNSNRLVMFEPDCSNKIYDSFDNSECLFIQEWTCDTNLSFKLNLSTQENRAVIPSSTKKGEFYDINLEHLDDNKTVGICNSKVDEIIRDITIKSDFYYIIYTNSVLHRIKRR